MKKRISLLLALVFIFAMVAACADDPQEPPAEPGVDDIAPPEVDDEPELDLDYEPEADEPEDDDSEPELEPITPRGDAPAPGDVLDAKDFDSNENPVPLGQWVAVQVNNPALRDRDYVHVRIVGIISDQDEVQAALDAYEGNRDFTLTDEIARDVEWRIMEFELHFPEEWYAPDRGISSIPSLSFRARPLETTSFRVGTISFIGVGTSYSLEINRGAPNPHPGDTVLERRLFSIVNLYDEGEYTFQFTWYDGEIVAANAWELFFATN